MRRNIRRNIIDQITGKENSTMAKYEIADASGEIVACGTMAPGETVENIINTEIIDNDDDMYEIIENMYDIDIIVNDISIFTLTIK